ncbi:MAG TPA: M23 family metallopeptidase [Candidatus Saccharimonadales bacterium]|nr:M23 family metallopeptidase [Candidatus Saccharimonadales bacterium]
MPAQHQTELHLPFEGEWLVFWGGDTPELNHHHDSQAEKYAFDFVVTDEGGNFYRDGERTNEASLAFGRPILSPAAGTAIETVDGVRDNRPGRLNTYSILGNYVLIKHNEDEFSLLAHLRQYSLQVQAGEQIEQGQLLAQCGNSGRSSDAHLHYQLQDFDVFAELNTSHEQRALARGIKAYFTDVLLERNGITKPRRQCSPVKDDIVSNA